METFTKEIKFLSSTFDGEKAVQEQIAKTATFKELIRTDKTQHDLHFDIVGLFINKKTQEQIEEDGESKGKIAWDMASMGALVVKAIKKLLIVDDKFTATDKTEFLQDSGAILNFSYWYVPEKLIPFFSSLDMK